MTYTAFSSLFMAFSLGALATFFSIHYWWSNARTIIQADLNMEQNQNVNRIHEQELLEEEVTNSWPWSTIRNENVTIGEMIRNFQ